MCLFCTVACAVWETMIGRYFTVFLPWDTLIPIEKPIEGAVIISLLVFFSYAIILNTVVPISLYVRFVKYSVLFSPIPQAFCIGIGYELWTMDKIHSIETKHYTDTVMNMRVNTLPLFRKDVV